MKHGLDQNDNQEEVKDTKKMSWDEKYGKKKGKKKGKKGLIIALIIIVAVVGLGAYGYSKAKGAAQALSDSLGDGTLVEEFGQKDMSAYVDVTGVAESQKVEKVITTLQYPVKEIKVAVGDKVKAGDVVCTIDTTD